MNRNTILDDSYSGQRVGIFVDTHSLFNSCKFGYNCKINYEKVLPKLADGRNVPIAKAYLLVNDQEQSDSFSKALINSGYDIEIKMKKFIEFTNKNNPGFKEERNVCTWDVGIALDMWQWVPKLDTILLVSQSGAFIDAIKRLRSLGNVRVEVAGFSRNISDGLKNAGNSFIELGPDKSEGNEMPDWLMPIHPKATESVAV